MKIYYEDLQFELTRRCNQECAHCCRGNSQELDLTKDIVDAFFDNNEIVEIGRLMFSGGEPTLNGDMLEYIVDKIIEKNINVDMFMFGINGLSYSESMINGLNKLYDYIKKSKDGIWFPGLLIVTQDQFHKKADEKVVSKLKDLPYLSPIKKYDLDENAILPYGRALDNNLSSLEQNLDKLTNYEKSYKIKSYEGENVLIIYYQYISSNGNVITDGCQDYEMMDKYSIGNVLINKIDDMYSESKKVKKYLKEQTLSLS